MYPTTSPNASSSSTIYGRQGIDQVNAQREISLQTFAPATPLWDLQGTMPPPPFPRIGNNGEVIPWSSAQTHTAYGQHLEPFPVASTIDAALAYSNLFNTATGVPAPSACMGQPISVVKFQNSSVFSEVQKQGIQAYYAKYHMPIGIAHQLEDLANFRFEFVLDDHPSTCPEQFHTMKQEVCKRVELLRHIPNTGIAIRMTSQYDKPLVFKVGNEALSTQVFENIEEYLRDRKPATHCTISLQTAYKASVKDAVSNNLKTIPYIFSARDLTDNKSSYSAEMKYIAKDLTKIVVNRPEDLVPLGFYPNSANHASNEIINRLDTIAKKVGVIRPYSIELQEVHKQQSDMFPFNEGCYIQASLLCPVNKIWDQIDEGRIFSQMELSNYLGTPITTEHYHAYFDKALNLQSKNFQDNEQALKNRKNIGKTSSSKASKSLALNTFATSTHSESVAYVPSLLKKIEEFRQHPDWTEEVEEGINRLCTKNNIPIGMGIQMIQVIGRHHEFNIDNSFSMSFPAHSDRQNGPTRMDELKSLLAQAGKFLSYLPTKSVTLSTFYDSTHQARHPYWIIDTPSHQPGFLEKYRQVISSIKPDGATPLNEAAKHLYERANNRAEKTNVVFFTDGAPSDHPVGFVAPHSSPSIVSDPAVRHFIHQLANRNAEKIPVTIAQTTDDDNAIAWTNLCDNVCEKVNAIDDKDNEIKEVRSRHGQQFHYDRNTYVMALLLGSDNALFDGLDENGIFSKNALESLYGQPINDKFYDQYFDEAYALQCAPGTETIKVHLDSSSPHGLRNDASEASTSGGYIRTERSRFPGFLNCFKSK